MDKFNKTLAAAEPIILSVFRIIVGLLLFQYGVAKIFKFPALPYFANPPPLIYAAGAIELVLGGLLILGLLTRPVALILSGEMAFAYFIGHFPKAFYPLINGGSGAILFCFACLYLVFAGGGPLSLDAMMGKKRCGGFPCLRPRLHGSRRTALPCSSPRGSGSACRPRTSS